MLIVDDDDGGHRRPSRKTSGSREHQTTARNDADIVSGDRVSSASSQYRERPQHTRYESGSRSGGRSRNEVRSRPTRRESRSRSSSRQRREETGSRSRCVRQTAHRDVTSGSGAAAAMMEFQMPAISDVSRHRRKRSNRKLRNRNSVPEEDLVIADETSGGAGGVQ